MICPVQFLAVCEQSDATSIEKQNPLQPAKRYRLIDTQEMLLPSIMNQIFVYRFLS